MQTIFSKNLRLKLGEVLHLVAAGNEYEIIFQKKGVSKIVPVNSDQKSSKKLVEFLNSKKFTNQDIPDKLKNYSNFKDLHKGNYTKYEGGQ